ncbi:MAG: OmpA family protein [Acidobacteriia bacterium]|nr:OmpA family protein [Terriglobia bacterium]
MSLRERFLGRTCLCAAAISLLLSSSFFFAQEAPTPKFDIFAGYSWMDPGGKVGNVSLPSLKKGFGITSTYNFNKWVGLSLDAEGHYGDLENISTVMLGPRFKLRQEHFEPFAQALFGLHRLSVAGLDSDNRFGAVFGGGFDIPLTRIFSLRLIEADYVWAHHNFRPTIVDTSNLQGARVRSGIVLSFGGGAPPPPLGASCSLNPRSVMAGEPVTMTTSTSNVIKGHTVTYDFSTSGGKATPRDNTVAIDTTGLAPGQYTVNATVTDSKAKKMAPATCSASFTVQEPPKHPPTVSCSANPATVQAGTPSTISATGKSPDNRPLTYGFTASGGRIAPSGQQATLDTAGAYAGLITVNCKATDDRGLSGSNSTSVNVEVPPPPPSVSKLNEIQFKNPKLPARVDNEAKAILDDVALRLQREPDAKAVVVGNFEPSEKNGQTLAEQRAVNTKAYLTQEKGIDPSRIDLRTGSGGNRTAEIYLVPPGTSFDVQGTHTFDASKMKAGKNAYPQAPAPKPMKKKAAKPAAPKP